MTRKNGKRPKAKRKTPKQTPKAKHGALVVQPGGRGAIWQGRPAHPAAGPGRPPSVVRERALGSFDQRISIVEGIADDVDVAPADRLRAVDVLGKYSPLGDRTLTVVSPDVRARLSQTVDAVSELLPADLAEKVLNRLEGIWR